MMLAAAAAAAAAAQTLALTISASHAARLTTFTPIVGRATCGDRSHLLTKRGELVEVTIPGRPVVTMHVSEELAQRPELWGLACLADGSLWTLESGHSLVRLTRDARIAERLHLQIPWITVFGHGNRLLFQALPIVAGVPVLAAVLPPSLESPTPWRGLVGRPGAGSTPSIARNLLRCGVASARLQLCWFVDEPTLVSSTGTTSRIVAIPASYRPELDREMPIWDAAAPDEARTWVLATSSTARGRRAADVVIVVGPEGRIGRVRMPTPARLIVFASHDRCTLLLASGEFVEVRAS